MTDALRKCELYVVRYVPDAVKGETVNIGVLLVSEDASFAQVRFTHDWRKVRCMDPAADVDWLQAIGSDVRNQLQAGGADREYMLQLLRDSFSNAVELAPVKACLTSSPEQELATFAKMYLESTRRAAVRANAGRGLILGRMKDAFDHAGVWRFMRKKIAAAEYTHKGDPLKLDCAYRPNGVIRFFQAVPLASDVDAAKVLAFSYPAIAEGVARVEKAKTELTAIVEDDLDVGDEQIAFALDTMQRSSILVATTAKLPQIAERARVELRV